MVKKWREEEEGRKTFPCTPSPTNRGQEVLEAKSGGSGRQGNQERDRKKEIHGGGGTRKERENGRLQEAPALTTSCWGCHCHRGGQGYLRDGPRRLQGRSPEINYARPPWSY